MSPVQHLYAVPHVPTLHEHRIGFYPFPMRKRMDLHGSLVSNLEAAVDSARRHRDKRVYLETVQHWSDLLTEARNVLATRIDADSAAIRRLADVLDAAIAKRS